MPVAISPVPPAPALRWSGGGGGGSSPGLQDYIQGLQMLGGVLALPRSAQYAQEDVLQKRAMLRDTGMSQAEIDKMFPDAPLGFLRPGEGVGGKILGGVGDVGALISTIAGQPIGPPRASISDLAAASKMRKEFKQQGAYEALAASVEKDDPVGANLIRSGNIDAYGRRSAAQLAHPPGDFGKSEMGMHARLAWLKANKPDSPEIPALEKAIADQEAHRPPTPPPPLTPEQRIQEKLDADRRLAAQQYERKRQQARDLGLVEGTDEYKRFMGGTLAAPPRAKDTDYYNKALEIVKSQTLPGQEVDMDAVDRLAAELQARHERFAHPPKDESGGGGGRGGAGTGGPPPPPPTPAPGGASYGEPPPTGGVTSERVTTATPEQLAARQRLSTMAQQQGVDPRGLRETNPDLWAAADLSGTENLPAEQFYKLLADPVAFAEWRAGQAAQTQQQSAADQSLPEITSDKTGKPMSLEGRREFMALQAERNSPGVTKERLAQIAIRVHQLE